MRPFCWWVPKIRTRFPNWWKTNVPFGKRKIIFWKPKKKDFVLLRQIQLHVFRNYAKFWANAEDDERGAYLRWNAIKNSNLVICKFYDFISRLVCALNKRGINGRRSFVKMDDRLVFTVHPTVFLWEGVDGCINAIITRDQTFPQDE